MAFNPDPGKQYRDAIVARRRSESARNRAIMAQKKPLFSPRPPSRSVTSYKPGFSPADIAEKGRLTADTAAVRAAEAARASSAQERRAAEQRAGSERVRVETQQREQAALNTQAMQGLIESYNQAYGAARESNEARYKQLLDIANQTTQQRQVDVTSAFGQKSADAMQGLARLGMANTTIAPTMQMGIERERQSALNRTADEMQQTKLGIIERRDDAFPDLGSLQSILVGAGASSGGGFGTAGTLGALGRIQSGPTAAPLAGSMQQAQPMASGLAGVGGFADVGGVPGGSLQKKPITTKVK